MKVNRDHLKLYMLGAAAAIGLALALQKHLGDRVEFSIKQAEQSNPGKGKSIVNEVKRKLKMKENKAKEGHAIFLKDIIGNIALAKSPKKDAADLEKKKEKLKEAAVDYIAEEMEEKLESIGMKKEDMRKIVESVSSIAESLIEGEDLDGVIGKFKDLDKQLEYLMKRIHPKLIQAIKRDQRS
jgi:hypothetical protein